MRSSPVNPPSWPRPKGYSNGIIVDMPGRNLYLAGQVAWDAEQKIVGEGDFGAQFRQVLENIRDILHQAGGVPSHLVRLTIFVKSKAQYEESIEEVGSAYRDVIGKHYPAMTLVEVSDLLEPGALLEIEATAALP